MSGRRGRRDLTEEERALWSKIGESIGPLHRRRRRRAEPAVPVETPAATPPAAAETPVSQASPTAHPKPPRPSDKPAEGARPPPRPKKPAPTPLAPIDTRTKRKLVRGTLAIEERLDLHGLTQHDAYGALRRFLAGAQARGARMVIVITGKGRRAGACEVFDPGERGVLRRIVPHWLGLPDLRDYVVGFEEAHVAHGGAGALYVRLRKPRHLRFDGDEP
jgi:DNA-nicking Smr family endonuclease